MAGTGGKREGAGRKRKSHEQNLVEKLKPYEDEALKVLVKEAKAGKSWALKLFMAYLYGMPKVNLQVESTDQNTPLVGFFKQEPPTEDQPTIEVKE